MARVEKVKWTLECPCRNNLLAVSEEADTGVGNHEYRRDKTGAFYTGKIGSAFRGEWFFRKDQNYAGPFITNSPFDIFLEITEKCNLDCKGCYLQKNGAEAELGQLEKIIDELARCGVKNIQLLGGEPTTHSKLPEICSYIKSTFRNVEIVSNGYNISDSMIKKLDKNADLFCISIDGNRDTHNCLRSNNQSYDRAVSSLNRLSAAGFETEIVMTLNRLNYKQIGHVRDLCKDGTGFYVKMFIPANGDSELSLSRENIEEIKEACEKLGVDATPFAAGFGKPGKYSFFGCPMGRTSALVDIKGDVFSCAYNRADAKRLGNMLTESLESIWSRNNQNIVENQDEKCGACNFQSRCGGMCTVKATSD
ncbi:MAG: radical SAM protein [archaeon]